ncbi:carbohydrate-binding module family 24 protein [Penicillium canescens]|uniref:Carbohydrate-binding module family 24 protein n=1 Tax=Penicillium canescens TaxID=5083 RepID=A0AAD6I355_PENCN|nr:carbohydrate-binding module family 24 protein [Penicillium canescens]KAJ6029918.1 carbohydrate-binding module family 24 protein [Penicillium canescens]KAJ6060297.1 carbohydrate-binding module family 24 protein [Penicillium canescens]KAJ6078082.1 carbohydrate-binding module family 24 protein [Penicillium canescens]
MKLLRSLVVATCYLTLKVQARAVFAHFMVSNTAGYKVSDWEDHMTEAIHAHIDAFALNIANDESTTEASLGNAFLAAKNTGFQLFFSFDYTGNGPWDKAKVIELLNAYAGTSLTYWHHNGQPLCSTFEGPGNAADWADIKKETNCFFVPDWSSLGAKVAMEQADGIADGLFNWAAWPYGPSDMDTYTDASYQQFLDGKPYMMPVSPWFFTNMPGYDKNWMWRGDDLWYDRWQQVMYLAPEFVEIISWNDYGESHYIGPSYDSHNELADATYVAFGDGYGDSPFNYAQANDHSGWRAFLPFLIDNYKQNVTTITEEGVSAWYRLNAAGACASDGGTTGNTVSQLQLEYQVKDIAQDKIFYSALLGSAAQVTVTIGGVDLGAVWTHVPSGNAGIYHGSVPFTGHSGDVHITITRAGGTLVSLGGESISSGCSNTMGIENWNAWVGSEMAGNSISVKSPSLANQVFIQGWGKGNFAGLCDFTCSLGYCPLGACVCSKMGPQAKLPVATGIQGYPTAGESASYSGLCSFACNYGNCIAGVCGTVEVPLTVPTISPFTPDTCTAGSGSGAFAGLCSYGCNVGYCPIHNCTCTATGPLNVPPAANASTTGLSTVGSDSGLCNFACERGYCPGPTCVDNADLPGGCANDDGSDPACAEPTVCNFTLDFSTLDALEDAVGNLDPVCVDFYTLDGLATVLEQTLNNYTGITNNYDTKFDEYVDYIKEIIPDQLNEFMRVEAPYGPGNQFFRCTYNHIGRNSTTGSCPGDIGIISGTYTVYYELVDEEGFYDKLSADYGIDASWVQLGTSTFDETCTPVMDKIGCDPVHSKYIGIPVKAADSAITVTNPKDIMTQALPNLQNLTATISVAKIELALGSWLGGTDDLVQSISMAVFMLSQAVTNMQEVVEVADSYEATKKKELINNILMGVLLVVPFLGEVDLVADAFVGLSRIITLIGDAAVGATTIYAIVEDPKMAPLMILETLLFSGMRNPDEFSAMGTARRGMSKENIKSLGSGIAALDNQFQGIVAKCLAK